MGFHFYTESMNASGNRLSYPSSKKGLGIEHSPFQRSYTKSSLQNSTKDVARSSVKHFDMSSPLRMLRRSCPQSPRVSSSQSTIQQGKIIV